LAGGVEWIQLAQNRELWWALVNTVMNFRVLAPQSLMYLLSYENDNVRIGYIGNYVELRMIMNGENYIMRRSIVCTLHKVLFGYQTKNYMGGAFREHGEIKMHTKF
jgi:hypothetical protein